jgi:hypothetical protein
MRFRLLPLMAVVAVLVAACGGSSTPTTTTKKQSSHKASATQTKTSASAGTSAGSTSTSSTSKPTFASISNCTDLSGIGSQFAKAMAASTSGGKIDLNAVSKAYQNLADAAPSALKPAIEKLAGAFTAYLSAITKAGYKPGTVPSATQLAAMEQAVKLITASDVTNAAKAAEAWAAKNCTGA